MAKEYDYLFKLVIVGNSGVGKSSLLMRYADDTFAETYLATIGVDFKFKTVPIDGKKVKMQIVLFKEQFLISQWDTAGQERFRTITSAYYKGADAIVMVFDTTNSTTFSDIDRFWINEVESYADKDVEILLLANKSDLTQERQVDESQVKEYSQKRNMEYFSVSAKTSNGVTDAFATMAMKLMEKKKAKLQDKIKRKDSNNKSVTEETSRVEEGDGKIKLGDANSASENGSLMDKFKKMSANCC